MGEETDFKFLWGAPPNIINKMEHDVETDESNFDKKVKLEIAYQLKRIADSLEGIRKLKTFETGTRPGVGKYICTHCGRRISINEEDSLPECKCKNKEFRK